MPTTVEIDQPFLHNNQQHSDTLLGKSGSISTTQTNKHALSAGSHYVIDNFDMFQKVRDMSEDRQNKDIHWVNHNKIVNRVSANHLANDGPICDLDDVDNSKLIPCVSDNISQRREYITLVERIVVSSIPYLSFCTEVFNDIGDIHMINSVCRKHKYHQILQRRALMSGKRLCGKWFINTFLTFVNCT